MTIKKIYTIDDITDEHLIDFIAGEITDHDLYDFIENSPSLKTKLDSYKKTHNLVTQLGPYFQEDNNLDNYSHITEATKSSDYSDSNLSWSAKLKVNGAAIFLDQSRASYGFAASILIAVAMYANIQGPALEWQARYNALEFDSELIDSDDWYKMTDEEVIYVMPNTNTSDLTFNIGNINKSSDNSDKIDVQIDDDRLSNMTALDEILMSIDGKLAAEFLIGVLSDMNSKKIAIAKLTRLQNKAITVNLYGKNSLKEDCILGEINYESDTVLSNTINSKFFNFCVLDTGNPIQMIN